MVVQCDLACVIPNNAFATFFPTKYPTCFRCEVFQLLAKVSFRNDSKDFYASSGESELKWWRPLPAVELWVTVDVEILVKGSTHEMFAKVVSTEVLITADTHLEVMHLPHWK